MNPVIFAACTAQLDIVFVVDASGSMDFDYSVTQLILKLIVYGLNFDNDNTRVGVVTFQNTPKTEFPLNQYTLKVSRNIVE